jgi:hypothetical protein
MSALETMLKLKLSRQAEEYQVITQCVIRSGLRACHQSLVSPVSGLTSLLSLQLHSIMATTSDPFQNGQKVDAPPLHLEYYKLGSCVLALHYCNRLCLMRTPCRVYMSMGQFEKAIPQFLHCLELREQQMGMNTQIQLATVLNLA